MELVLLFPQMILIEKIKRVISGTNFKIQTGKLDEYNLRMENFDSRMRLTHLTKNQDDKNFKKFQQKVYKFNHYTEKKQEKINARDLAIK